MRETKTLSRVLTVNIDSIVHLKDGTQAVIVGIFEGRVMGRLLAETELFHIEGVKLEFK